MFISYAILTEVLPAKH